MNSDAHIFNVVSAEWHIVPHIDAINAATIQLIRRNCPDDRSTNAFYRLLTSAVRSLTRAADRGRPSDISALGLALAWLSAVGGPDELHYAFLAGDTDAPLDIILALRRALLGQMQTDHRRYLLAVHCPSWSVRRDLAAEWLARLSNGAGAAHEAWEFTGNLDGILDSAGSGRRLFEQLGGNSPPSDEESWS